MVTLTVKTAEYGVRKLTWNAWKTSAVIKDCCFVRGVSKANFLPIVHLRDKYCGELSSSIESIHCSAGTEWTGLLVSAGWSERSCCKDKNSFLVSLFFFFFWRSHCRTWRLVTTILRPHVTWLLSYGNFLNKDSSSYPSVFWLVGSFPSAVVCNLFLSLLYNCQLLCFWRLALTLRWLMPYIYGATILDVSRSHTTTQHSR